MVSAISEGVQISVEVFYQEDYSFPIKNEYVFAYKIGIENHNAFAVQLLRRQWYIFDGNLEIREVEGAGVICLQPVIGSGQGFDYTSACNLQTDIGKMTGYYTFENQDTKELFKVNIPAFFMVAPSKLN